jgi:hypothetical protein
MRITNTREMADAIRENRVGEKEFWFYGLVFIALTIWGIVDSIQLFRSSELLDAYDPSFLVYVEQILMWGLEIVTLFIAYRIHKTAKSSRFWYHFFSINFPLFIIVMIVAFCVGFVATLYLLVTGQADADFSVGYTMISVHLLVSVIYLYYFIKYMKIVSETSIPESPSTNLNGTIS